MRVTEILEEIKSTAGSNAKKAILYSHSQNDLLKKVLLYGMDSFTPFNVVKIPKVRARLEFPLGESEGWSEFFSILDECSSRQVTGNAAIERVYTCFCSVRSEEEVWMRKILKKHLSIGASTKTVNKIFPGLIPTFEVSLAQKFEEKRLVGKSRVGVEPKLDGIRCFAIVEDGTSLLYARSGKLIPNFNDTIGRELSLLPDGCYDGEIMGEDFVALMRQVYRKDNVVTEGTYLALFDYLPTSEWKSGEPKMSCEDRYTKMCESLKNAGDLKYLQKVMRYVISADYDSIKHLHDEFASEGYEGAMVKDLDAPYKFGRGYEVMKMKVFHDVDLPIDFLEEGTGKHVGKLGSVREF